MTRLIYMRACYEGCALIAWTQVRLLCWWLTSWNKHSSKPITLPPPRLHVLSKRYFYFFFICLISTIRFVCTHSYIILQYILLRQTARWAIFLLSRRKAVAVALRTCILHKPAQDDHFLLWVKTDSSAAPRLSLDRNEERYMREDYIIYTSRQWG